jgi:glycine reductase
MKKIRVVHFINQFYGQIGGEDKADIATHLKEGFVWSGNADQQPVARTR